MARVTSHDGARLKVREIGRGPVVVLLHGFGMARLIRVNDLTGKGRAGIFMPTV